MCVCVGGGGGGVWPLPTLQSFFDTALTGHVAAGQQGLLLEKATACLMLVPQAATSLED